jgi:3,4-dihydroxy 2-butanone 4-phosphate synthase/GTP cyclohydrolase II
LLDISLQRINDLGGGVVIYLRSGFVGVPLDTLTNPEGQTKEGERKAEWLEIGVGAQILRDLGVSRIRIIAGREVDYVGIEGFGLTLEATELLTD